MNDNTLTPPLRKNAENGVRRVGVEIELGGIAEAQAAKVVQQVFGGTITEQDPFRFNVKTPDMGTFIVELDSQYAHPDKKAPNPTIKQISKARAYTVGAISSAVVPTEIVSPPLPYTELEKFDELIQKLAHEGAKGTEESILYGFGVHFNPEVAETSVHYILNHLRAFLLLQDELYDAHNVDMTRKLLPFIKPFEDDYIQLVTNPDYHPTLQELIKDYIRYNPTRDRGLDMLPLFAHLQPKLVKSLIDNPLIKPRPTFHYRLPNTDFINKNYTITSEWKKWLKVEHLATSPDDLKQKMRERHAA